MNFSSNINSPKIKNNQQIIGSKIENKSITFPTVSRRSIRFEDNDEHSLQKTCNISKQLIQSPTLREIELQKISQRYLSDDPLTNSKGYIQNNSRCLNKKYEYGDEGVHVKEEVVQKYKASNYLMQRDMLQKFKREAEQFRRNKNKRPKNQNLSEFSQNQSSLRAPREINNFFPKTALQLKHQENMRKYEYQMELLRRNQIIKEEQEKQERRAYEQRKRIQKQRKKQRKREIYIQRQKQNMIKVGNMLRQINFKIKENSVQISNNLKQLREELDKKNKHKQLKILKIITNKFTDNDSLDDLQDGQFLSPQHKQKLPVILYNDKYSYSKSYLGQENKTLERINGKDCYRSADNLKNIVNILRKNENRIKELSSLSLQQQRKQLQNDF